VAELADGERYRPVMLTRGGQARLVGPGVVGQEGDIVHFAVRSDALGDINAKLATAAERVAGAGAAPLGGPVPSSPTQPGGHP
jgi:hypothetical protein